VGRGDVTGLRTQCQSKVKEVRCREKAAVKQLHHMKIMGGKLRRPGTRRWRYVKRKEITTGKKRNSFRLPETSSKRNKNGELMKERGKSISVTCNFEKRKKPRDRRIARG